MLRPPPRPALFPYTTLFRSKLTFEIEDGLAPVDQPDIEPWLALHIAKRGVHQARVKPQGGVPPVDLQGSPGGDKDRKSTRLNSSHVAISYAVFCLKKKKKII